jgi:hypothetical protein
MLLIDFQHQLPKCEEVAKISVHYYDKESDDCYSDCLGWLEDTGYTFCVIPCEDGLVIIQWYGVNSCYGYTVREIGQ